MRFLASAHVVLDFPVEKTEKALVRATYLGQLHSSLAWLLPVIERNRNHALVQLEQVVRTVVRRVKSAVEFSPRLEESLSKAIEWVTGPGAKAAETRREHERIAKEAAAKALAAKERADKEASAKEAAKDPNKDPSKK